MLSSPYMKTAFFPKSLLTHFVSALSFFLSLALAAEAHPRLLFDAADIPALRDKLNREPFASMYAELVAFAEADDTTNPEYEQSSYAINCGFLYVLTGDDAWAQKARGYVESRLADTSTGHGWDMNIKGLSLYWHGRAVALAYDFCFDAPSWNTSANAGSNPTAPFVDYVASKLKDQADRIYEDGGTQQNKNKASNWQNNRFASAGLIYLAIEDTLTPLEKENIDGSLARVETYLVANMGDSPDSRGYNIEAIGYQMYPWAFTGPFAIAAERLGYGRLADAAPAAAAYALWNVYSSALRIPHVWGTHFGIHLDFGDDNNNHRGEGCYGLAFYFCPEFLHPGLRWWYDRLVGEQGDQTWDRERHGLMYSILFYNDSVAPAEPWTIREWTNAYLETGGNGYFSFRNSYTGGADIMAQLYAKFRGNAGHSGPDALSFRIAGLDAPFAVGGGRYGPDIYAGDTGKKQDAYLRSMNTLYPVDPENELTISGYSGQLLGVPQLFAGGGGSVSLYIDRNNVNTMNHTRRFLADYSPASGAKAVYVIADTSDDGNWWQLCQVDLDPNTQAITTSGNTFTVTNPNGTWMQGTVLYPDGALNFETGSRIRGSTYGYYGEAYGENEYVHFQSADGDYLVVLTIGDADTTPPDVMEVAGTGANEGRLVQVGGLEVTIDGDFISRGNSLQQPPSIMIASPAPLAELAPGPVDLNVDGRAFPGQAAIDTVEVYYGPESEYLGDVAPDPQTGAFSFQLPGLALGHHIFRVKAIDVNGLARYSGYVPVSVHHSQPPQVRILQPSEGDVFSAGSLIDMELEAGDVDGSLASVTLSVNGFDETLSGAGPWSRSYSAASPGLVRIELSATDDSGESSLAGRDVHVSQGQLPDPWIHFDVGDVAAAGSANLDGGTLTLNGSGNDIWNDADEFHFIFQPCSGNAEVVTQVLTQDFTDDWAKAGPLFRASAAADAPYVGIFVTPGNGVTLQRRSSGGSSTSSTRDSGISAPVWLRLLRLGNTFTGYYRSTTSDPWTRLGSYSVELPDEALAGIGGTSHNDGAVMTATFNPVTLEQVFAPDVEGFRLASSGPGQFATQWMSHAGHRDQLMISTDMESWVPFGLPAQGEGEAISRETPELSPPFFLRVVRE